MPGCRTAPSHRSARELFPGLVLCLVLLGNFGDDRSPGEHLIEIKGAMFPETPVVVMVGDTVTWRNLDVVPHNVTVAAGDSDDWTSGPIGHQDSFRWIPVGQGRLEYRCTWHPTMTGLVIVLLPE